MSLHLIKLAVGCESVKELKGWVAERMATAKKKGLPLHHIHITRMTPKRGDEIVAGGSLYWVIRGEIAAREKIIAIEPFRDKEDRKSTRLNSSHANISYAVFCLKKKTTIRRSKTAAR